jgi:alkylation response protein AidB-like acyl-CoA dehydrogenase
MITWSGPDNFRRELREWLLANVPESGDALSAEEQVARARDFQARLFDSGYAGLTWPLEYGGRGLGEEAVAIFEEETAGYELPTQPLVIGMGMCGPTVVDLGTEEQKRRYIPPLLRGEEIWCQLFSEPGAGSDIAGLHTRAVRHDDGWVITGQKVWTTNAQLADFGAVLARTDPDLPKHGGLTMFIMDMRQSGVTVRPLRDMTGGSQFNEVFFEAAKVPADGVLGQVNEGWHAAMTMLSHERVSVGTSKRPKRARALTFEALLSFARLCGTSGDPTVRQQLADLYARERVLELYNARLGQEADAGRAARSPSSPERCCSSERSRSPVRSAGAALPHGKTTTPWVRS